MTVQLWQHATLSTLQGGDWGLVSDGALVVQGDTLAWVGPRSAVPAHWLQQATQVHDAGGALITPGLVDCHTHLVYGGDRAHEFNLRLNGASYEEIAAQGGGIVSTVAATRAASLECLQAQALARLRALQSDGVTTLEIKSGYGLALEHEAKCLRVARALGVGQGVQVRTSFLGAHAVPPEYVGHAEAYLEQVLAMLPVLHAQGLVDAVDAFCERIAFSPAQVRRVFEAAQDLGLPVKLHAEQLSDSGGAALAAEFGALSCDHLEWLSPEGAQAMARAGTVAVLLPVAFYFLRETRLPPVALLRQHGVPLAVSTDCNPGSSPCSSLLLALNMACTLFRLTPLEALRGATVVAARALGLHDRGCLAPGQRADFVLWALEHPQSLCYALGAHPRLATVQGGQLLALPSQALPGPSAAGASCSLASPGALGAPASPRHPSSGSPP